MREIFHDTSRKELDMDRVLQNAQLELLQIRCSGHRWPGRVRDFVSAIRAGVQDGFFTLEKVGTTEAELARILDRAGLQ